MAFNGDFKLKILIDWQASNPLIPYDGQMLVLIFLVVHVYVSGHILLYKITSIH